MISVVFEYQFVRHEVRRNRSQIDDQCYQQVIAEQASLGWRLVQILVEEPAAVVSTYVLIFERPAE